MVSSLLVLGGGAAGLAAAREANRRSHHATLISSEELGGDCTFTGCIPSKTLIESATAGASLSEAFERARMVVAQVAATENTPVLEAEGIGVIRGRGTVTERGGVTVDGRHLSGQGLVVATGSRPTIPNIDGLQDLLATGLALTTNTLWDSDLASLEQGSETPTVAIIGAGAIGCELALALSSLGVHIELLEAGERPLGTESKAVSELVAEQLRKSGVRLLCRSRVSCTRPLGNDDRVTISYEQDLCGVTETHGLEADRVLVVVGRTANLEGLHVLDVSQHAAVLTNAALRTSLKGVYAAGDVTGISNFTHAADAMGRLAAANVLRRVGRTPFRPELVPRVTFTSPEVASIGLSEHEAAVRYPTARVAELPLAEHDRARTVGMSEGFIQLIAAPRRFGGSLGGGRLVGASIVAPRAGELISELSLLMRTDAMIGRLAQTIHPYPSWSYGLAKTAGQFFTEVEGRTARPAARD